MSQQRPLSLSEIEARLDVVLIEHSGSPPVAPTLTRLSREQQEFVLKWVDVIAKTSADMAYQFATHVGQAMTLMALPDVEAWIIQAMDTYDRMGLHPAGAVLRDMDSFARTVRDKASVAELDKVAHVLELFVRGLSGRALKLESGEETYTDSDRLFLPASLTRFAERDWNFRLYKAMVAHQWAQTRYGSFREPVAEALSRYPDPARALRLFHALETIRLDARLAAELTGLHRDMATLRSALGETLYPNDWEQRVAPLRAPDATARDSLALIDGLYRESLPEPLCYQGVMQPERVQAATATRMARDKNQLCQALLQMLHDKEGEAAAADPQALGKRFSLTHNPDADEYGEFDISIQLDGKPVTPPADVRALIQSILQDLGQIPDDYLTAAGDGGYRRDNEDTGTGDPRKDTDPDQDALLYNEWDFRREHYRKDWCVLREIDVHPVDEPFAARTRIKYAGLIHTLHRSFEALRGEEKLMKKQINGDNVDLDALVEAWADMHTGQELSERLFTKLHKLDRNIAVVLMVDMSGSTKGWINDAERESLVLLCEALEILGDRYAIYGFSGMTRNRCELYRVKRFDEPYSDLVRARIAGIHPKDYTRMGVTIRHLTKLLTGIDARTKLLITLSDGKPDDYDGYRGDYGIEDTRMALIEARRAGIHPFCITIDTEARDYLPHMYGAVNWALVEDVRKLPIKVSEIYRRLTL